MPKSAFDVVRDNIISFKEMKQDAVVNGNAQNYPEYRELCGTIKGLDFALTELEDLLQSHEVDEDDD